MDASATTGLAPVNILAVGRNKAILEVIERLVNAHEGWHATIAETEQDAIKAVDERHYAIVFVSAGFSAQEEDQLRQKLANLDPGAVVTRHYGGGSGLLENEILTILEKDKV
jgi:PleD family two-component response regulator